MTNDKFSAYHDYGEQITDGIDITTWNVPVPGGDKKSQISYSVWDFAGQTVYYNTHQVCMLYSVFIDHMASLFIGMVWFRFMVFNTTFNNISVISWWSVLLVEETGVPVENHRPVVSSTPHRERGSNSQL